jgi:hypothetical protein
VSAHDGQTFHIALTDIPEGETTVAIKVVDMLGEEVVNLVTLAE